MTGPEAARLFYSPEHFQRAGAQPGRVQKVLFGKTGVQHLDDGAHRFRKEMILPLMTPERVWDLRHINASLWEGYADLWTVKDRILLYPQLREMLARAVCQWAGVHLKECEIPARTEQLSAQFHGAGAFGFKYWRARTLRKRADTWAQQIIREIRFRRLAPESRAAHVIAFWRDPSGNLLDPYTAGVELLNILRPTVAVAIFIAFAAHAMHQYPEVRAGLRDENYIEMFAQEVRRFYPFFPALIAQTTHEFIWNGLEFPAHTRTMLDIYGTNHDPRAWRDPDQFVPERFKNGSATPFNFIPQGGGDAHTGHRCPGEFIALELIKLAVKFMTTEITYVVPDQNLKINFRHAPATIESGFVLSNVRRV
ncbi:MAG TPA: cytochrome P450 [Verrucomicrobiae bacterium]|jgi:fatty-acid peroxygenase|nr:cytochrome P450 [Verrucomicrobiae bacterium]